MITKSNDSLQKFETFWDHVTNAERDIRENGHLGRLPPPHFGDPWDEEFAAALHELIPLLRKFRKLRFYLTPVGLAFRPSPILAETAHEALMFFLNRPEELHGEKGVLDSTEYLAIKAAAMLELQELEAARVAPKRISSCSRSAKRRSELIELRGFLLDFHLPEGKPFRARTLTSAEIEAHFGWSQSKVSRRMSELFKDRNGMKGYGALFGTHTTTKGFRNGFDNKTLTIEAIWHDKKDEDDEDEELDDDGIGCPVLN